MKKKPLMETNPYLKEPKKYRKALIITVASSTAIETGAPVKSIAKTLSGKTKKKQNQEMRYRA